MVGPLGKIMREVKSCGKIMSGQTPFLVVQRGNLFQCLRIAEPSHRSAQRKIEFIDERQTLGSYSYMSTTYKLYKECFEDWNIPGR